MLLLEKKKSDIESMNVNKLRKMLYNTLLAICIIFDLILLYAYYINIKKLISLEVLFYVSQE